MKAVVQGNVPLLDSEIPAANGVATARGLARMYGALANGGQIDGVQYLSRELTAGLIGRPSLRPDRSVLMPMSFHLGYHSLPIPGVLPGFRPCRARRIARLGYPRSRTVVRFRAQPVAHAVRDDRSGRLCRDGGA